MPAGQEILLAEQHPFAFFRAVCIHLDSRPPWKRDDGDAEAEMAHSVCGRRDCTDPDCVGCPMESEVESTICYPIYDDNGTEIGCMSLLEARSRFPYVEFDSETKIINVLNPIPSR